eukprot:COSAG05_NODE_20380_length_280_cov_0.569061_2_plen_32_part_01
MTELCCLRFCGVAGTRGARGGHEGGGREAVQG